MRWADAEVQIKLLKQEVAVKDARIAELEKAIFDVRDFGAVPDNAIPSFDYHATPDCDPQQAWLYACTKAERSNLARCYLAAWVDRSRLRHALKVATANQCECGPTSPPSDA